MRPGRGRCDGAGLRPAPVSNQRQALRGRVRPLETAGNCGLCQAVTHTRHDSFEQPACALLCFCVQNSKESARRNSPHCYRNVVVMGCSGMHSGPRRDHNRPREREHMDPQTAHMSFHLFVLCMRLERVRTKASLCCRGTSQPSSALGPLTMCSDSRLRAEAPIEFTRRGPVRPGIVAICGISNVSALPLKYTRCTFAFDAKKGGECLGIRREGNDWPED